MMKIKKIMLNIVFLLPENEKLLFFCVWEDIVEVKSRLLLTLLGSVYYVAQSYKPV